MDLDVSIIVSNRNGHAMLRDCLASLHGSGAPRARHEILVTDNASTDGSLEMVRAEFPAVRILRHETDIGFVASNNRAIKATTGRHVHLVNNDTLVLPGAIDYLVSFLDREPKAGACGNRLIFPDGRDQFSGRRFPSAINALFGRRSLLSRWFPNNPWVQSYTLGEDLAGDEPFEVDWVSAAGALYRRAALDDVGPMFENYYYWHEAAYFLAMQRRGWKVFLHPGATIIHYEGLGSGRRSPAVWARHHWDFARGSQQFYCEYKKLGVLSPRRWLSAGLLFGRAVALSAAAAVRPPATHEVPVDLPNFTRAAYGRLVQHLLASENSTEVVLLTSVTSGEGVSTSIAAIGLELTLRGQAETLMVDANAERPGLHRLFWRENDQGLSDLTRPNGAVPTVHPIVPRLHLLPHGRTRYDLATRATCDRLVARLREIAPDYRVVLIDAAPLDQSTDALALAPHVDGVILVVRAEGVDRERVLRAATELRETGANLLGAIYNGERFYIPESIYRRV